MFTNVTDAAGSCRCFEAAPGYVRQHRVCNLVRGLDAAQIPWRVSGVLPALGQLGIRPTAWLLQFLRLASRMPRRELHKLCVVNARHIQPRVSHCLQKRHAKVWVSAQPGHCLISNLLLLARQHSQNQALCWLQCRLSGTEAPQSVPTTVKKVMSCLLVLTCDLVSCLLALPCFAQRKCTFFSTQRCRHL